MCKTWLCLLAALISLAALGLTALAGETEPVWSGPTESWVVTNASSYASDSFCYEAITERLHITLTNPEEIEAAYGSLPSYETGSLGFGGSWIFGYDSLVMDIQDPTLGPGDRVAECVIPLSDGSTISFAHTYHFVERPKPQGVAGLDVPNNELVVNVGETFSVAEAFPNASFLPADWGMGPVFCSLELPFDTSVLHPGYDDNSNVISITPSSLGSWQINLRIHQDGVRAYTPVKLRVVDPTGTLSPVEKDTESWFVINAEDYDSANYLFDADRYTTVITLDNMAKLASEHEGWPSDQNNTYGYGRWDFSGDTLTLKLYNFEWTVEDRALDIPIRFPDGATFTVHHTFHFVERAEPQGVAVQGLSDDGVVQVNAGQTYIPIASFLPADWGMGPVGSSLQLSSDDEESLSPDYNESGNAVSVTPSEPGFYVATMYTVQDGVSVSRRVVLQVNDENGNPPEAALELVNDVGEPIDYTLESTVFMSTSGTSEGFEFPTAPHLTAFIRSYEALTILNPDAGEPEWDLTWNDDAIGLGSSWYNDPGDQEIFIDRWPEDEHTALEITGTLTARWLGQEDSVPFTLHVLPGEFDLVDLESGSSFPEQITLAPGERTTLRPAVELTDGTGRFTATYIDYGFSVVGVAEAVTSADGDTITLSHETPGVTIVDLTIEFQDGLVTYRGSAVLMVTDENGNVPAPTTMYIYDDVSAWDGTLYITLPVEDGAQISFRDGGLPLAYIGSWETYSLQLTDSEPQWTFTCENSSARLSAVNMEGGRCGLVIDQLPAAPTTETWTLTCEWGGLTAETDIELQFVKGNEWYIQDYHRCMALVDDQSRTPLTLEAGYMSYDPAVVDLSNPDAVGVTPDDEHCIYGIAPGYAHGTVTYHASNLQVVLPLDVRVSGSDGTMAGIDTLYAPDGLTEVQAGAFAGTAFERVVLGGNVQSVESGAFADMPNLKEVQCLNPATVVAPDAFGGARPYIVVSSEGEAKWTAEENGWTVFLLG